MAKGGGRSSVARSPPRDRSPGTAFGSGPSLSDGSEDATHRFGPTQSLENAVITGLMRAHQVHHGEDRFASTR